MTTPRYYRVSPKFWSDPDVQRWSDDAKLLAFYLLTCEHRTTEGLFVLKKKYAQVDLGWDAERFGKGFTELLEAGFVHYDDDAQVCLIVKAIKWQPPQNENQAKYAVKQLLSLPPTPLTCIFKGLAERFAEHLVKQLPKGFGEGYADPLALDPEALAPSPPPSLGSPNGSEPVGGEVNGITLQLLREGFVASDLQAPIRELESELATNPGRLTSPIAWTRARAEKQRQARLRSEASTYVAPTVACEHSDPMCDECRAANLERMKALTESLGGEA